MGRIASTLFGVIFGIIWISIWVFVVVGIIKGFKNTKQIRNTSNQIFNEVNQALKNGSVHTGNPHNPYYRTTAEKKAQANADNFSDIGAKEKDSDTFASDLNPRTGAQRVYTTKSKVNGRKVRGDRSYSVNPSERPAHGKLSRESRDDEKEWF